MRPWCQLAAGFVAALALVGCGGNDNTNEATVATTTVSAPETSTTAARACTPATGYGSGTTQHQLTIAGAAREFLVHVPPEPTPGMPLVISFHAAGFDMQRHLDIGGFAAVADAEGFVVATPNGMDSGFRQWRFLGDPADVAFTGAIIDDLVAQACVDGERVYASGLSSGSAMTNALACSSSDRFAGFAFVALTYYIDSFCETAQIRPIVIFHGTADESIPYEGGTVASGSGRVVESVESSAAGWAGHNGCEQEPTKTRLDPEIVRFAWSGCEAPVVFYRIVGGGHTWPGGGPLEDFGHTTTQLNATQTMWEFWHSEP